MIENTTEYYRLIKKFLEKKIDDNGDDYHVERALRDLIEGEWGEYCPYMQSEFRAQLPVEYYTSCNGDELWENDCADFDEEDEKFIIDVIGADKLPPLFFMNGGPNHWGCKGCWSFNFYYTLAHIINNEGFWKLS